MRNVILGLSLVVLAASPVFASGRCKNGNCKVYQQPTRVYSIPTVGKATYTIASPSVARPATAYTVEPSCKNGKCRLSK